MTTDSTPAFDAPPEVQAKAQKLEADIAAKPTATALYLQLAQLYADAKRKDLAAQVLERCLKREPGNVYVRHKLAQITGKPEASSRVTASFQAVSRPQPPAPRPAASPSRSRWLAVGGGLLAIALLFGLKLWLFPSTRRLVAGDFKAFAPVWSPSGAHLAFLIEDGRTTRLAVYDFAKGTHRVLGAAAPWDASFAWSSDGSKLAWSALGGEGEFEPSIYVADAEEGAPRRLAAGSSPRWAIDGQTLIAVCGPDLPGAVSEDEEMPAYSPEAMGQRYCRIDAASGDVQRSRVEARMEGALSGASESVVFEAMRGGGEGESESGTKDFDELVDAVAAGKARNVAEGSRDLSRELHAREYSRRKAAGRTAERLPYAADVLVASVSGGDPVAVTSDGHSAFPTWTEDGSRILFAAEGPSGVEFCTVRPDGGDRQTVLRGVKGVDPFSVRLSRDGSSVFFVASVPGDEGVSKIMTGESPADLHVAPVGAGSAKRLANRHSFKQRYAVSPEGDRIVYEVLQDVKLIGGAGKSELWLMRR